VGRWKPGGEFEWWKEWEPGETTREQLEQLKGQEQLLCLAGVGGLGEVLAGAPPLDSEAVGLSTMATGTRMRAGFKAPEQGMNPLSNSERPKIHSGKWDPKAISGKHTVGEEELDIQLATRLEAANQRLRALSAECPGTRNGSYQPGCDCAESYSDRRDGSGLYGRTAGLS